MFAGVASEAYHSSVVLLCVAKCRHRCLDTMVWYCYVILYDMQHCNARCSVAHCCRLLLFCTILCTRLVSRYLDLQQVTDKQLFDATEVIQRTVGSIGRDQRKR